MTCRSAISSGELEALAAEYRHVREEHRRARIGGRVRRRFEARLAELGERFERLLAEGVAGEAEREAWRAHLRHALPAPAKPGVREAPLRFRGRAETGSVVEVYERPDGDCDVLVDGVLTERVGAGRDFAMVTPGHVFRLNSLTFRETFAASPAALAALRAHVAAADAGPPYGHAEELLADGLIDRDFGLTPRGRRALGPATAEVRSALDVRVSTRGPVAENLKLYAARKVARVVKLAPRPVLYASVTLGEDRNPALERPAIAKATLDVSGHGVRAHVAAPELVEAVDLLEERLSRRLGELSEHMESGRRETGLPAPGEWRHGDLPASRPGTFPRPPEERELVRRKTFAGGPVTPEEAAWEMRLLDHDFHLFEDAVAGEECVVYVRPDGVLGLKEITPANGTYVEPFLIDPAPAPRVPLDEALVLLDTADEPFVFFVDPETGRGAVVYRRYDGHYGLITPAER